MVDELKTAIATQSPQGTQLAPAKSVDEVMQDTYGMTVAEMRAVTQAVEDNVNDNEVRYSRLAIMQSLSPEIVSDSPGYKKGMIIDNLSREIYSFLALPPWLKGKVPDEELKLIQFSLFLPVFKLPSEYIKWKNRKEGEGKGMHWKTLDVNDPRVKEGIWPPRGKWMGTEKNPKAAPPVSENINMFGMMLNLDYAPLSAPLTATFAKTSFNAGKTLVTACQQHKLSNLPYWGRVYFLMTKLVPAENPYYVFDIVKGPALGTVNPDLLRMVGSISKGLADPEHGRERQEAVINASFIDETGDEETENAKAGADVADDGSEPDPFK